MKKTVIEKLSEVAKLIKDKFEDSTEAPAEATATEGSDDTAKFMEVSTADGETVLSYDGELAEGTAIFVVDAESGEQIPAVEGTYVLGGDMMGTSIVVNAEGMVAEVIAEEVEEAEAEATEEEAMSSEDVESIVDTKMSSLNDSLNALVSGIESILKENDSLKADIAEFKTEFAEFKELPSVEKNEKKKFSRNDKPMSEAETRTAKLINQRKNN